MQLLYRGTEDKFTAEAFHARCDNSSPPTTLTFVKSEFDRVFGGFASIPWTSSAYNDYSDEKAFIFSLTHRTKHEQSQLKEKALRHYPGYLPTFGYAHDFHICDNCDSVKSSHSLFGHSVNSTYALPVGIEPDSEDALNYLAGG